MKILVVGFGFVGLTVGVSFASSNDHIVYGLDIDHNLVNTVNSGKAHFHEPGLNELISKHIGLNLFCKASVDELPSEKFDVVIISVGTPVKQADGVKIIDTAPISRALDSIRSCIDVQSLIVLRSTVKVGTTRNLVASKLSNYFNVDKNKLLLSFCPERTVEGNALTELRMLPQIISGINKQSLLLSNKLFSSITSDIIDVSSIEAAELVKLFNNTYRDTNFAIANLFNLIAQSHDLDGLEIINTSNYNYNRSKIALPGFVGGPCLTKDAHILIDGLSEELGSFVSSARSMNASLPERIANWIEKKYKSHNFDFVSLSGLAFKGTPATSDIRDSPSVDLINILKKKNIPIVIHDFEVYEKDLRSFDVEFFEDFSKLIHKSQFLICLNNHSFYQNYKLSSILDAMSMNNIEPLVFDAWGVLCTQNCSPKELAAYHTFGSFEIK